MEFSRALAHASFTGLKWLMLVCAVLFAALAIKQLFGVATVSQAVTIGGAAASAALAWLFGYLARRIIS